MLICICENRYAEREKRALCNFSRITQNVTFNKTHHMKIAYTHFFLLLEYFVVAGNVCNPKSNSLSHLIVIYCTFCKIFILISSAIRCDFGLFVFFVSMNLCSVSPDTHTHSNIYQHILKNVRCTQLCFTQREQRVDNIVKRKTGQKQNDNI